MSPYLVSLTCILGGLLLFVNGLMVSFCIDATRGMSLSDAIGTGIFQGVLFIAGLSVILLGVLLRSRYEYFGRIEIYPDRVVFRTLFCKPRVFLYSELADIGIDYGFLSLDHRQFWIYFSKVPLDTRYTHNILRLPFSAESMRVQYRRELYDALLDAMPLDRIGKRLARSHSVIQLYRVDQEVP